MAGMKWPLVPLKAGCSENCHF